MLSRSTKRVTLKDVDAVQKLIERCLQEYMDQEKTMETLLYNEKVDHVITKLVWEKLEEENPEFFNSYYSRLELKQQIMEFNTLLKEQVWLMRLLATLPPLLGRISLHNPACYVDEQIRGFFKPENIQHPVGSRLPNVGNNGGSSLHTSMRAAVDMPMYCNRINGPSSIGLAQCSKMDLMQGNNAAVGMSPHCKRINGPSSIPSAQCSNMDLRKGNNGGMINSDPRYSSCSPCILGADGNVLKACATIGDTLATPITNTESNSHPLNEDLSEIFGQISGKFCPSDPTAHLFSESYGTVQNYPMSPFLVTNNGNFLRSGLQGWTPYRLSYYEGLVRESSMNKVSHQPL